MMDRENQQGTYLKEQCGIRLAGAGGNLICLTASGKVLNKRGNPEEGLKAFRELPPKEREPGAVKVEPLTAPPASSSMPEPPASALILKQYYRNLAWNEEGKLRRVTLDDFDNNETLERKSRTTYKDAAPDFVWLKKTEWQSLIPQKPQVGNTTPVPVGIAQRIFRFHLVPDILYGESNGWKSDAVREGRLTLTVREVTDNRLVMELQGEAKVGQTFETVTRLKRQHSSHGYEPQLLGNIEYDRKQQRFTRFDMVALGNFYGTLYGDNRLYFRTGRQPLGIAFHLVNEKSPRADREVCPRGLKNRKWMQNYYNAAR